MRNRWKTFVSWVEHSVALPEDSESLRIRKTTLAIVWLFAIPVNFILAISLLHLNLSAANWINLTMEIISISVTIYLFRTRNFVVFHNIAIGSLFVWIYGLQASMGGIFPTEAFLSWGVIAAMSAAFTLGWRAAAFWGGINVIGFTVMLAFEERIRTSAPLILTPTYEVIYGFINALWISALAMLLILYLLRELETAQNLADQLLYNILPKQIAARLKQNPGTIADAYDNTSILIADIVGYTPLSNQLSPIEMVELLNAIYSYFDALVEKYLVEKINIVGDSYTVASGVPESRSDHAQALAFLALDMIAYCKQLQKEGSPIQFRIGINSGPLVAGVIGNKKFQYALWGDTINTASRMESHGTPGKIQVTEDTYELLKNEFLLEPRGTINVKGKGQMNTWFLIGSQKEFKQTS